MLSAQITDSTDHLAILRELGEWAALGFYEGSDLPWPRAFGLAYRRLYEHMEIVIPEDRYLIPYEPLPRAHTRASHGYWYATSLICSFRHHAGLVVNLSVAEEKKAAFPQHADFIDHLAADLQSCLPYFGGYTHSNPDIRRVVSEGFLAMEEELVRELALLRQADTDANQEELHLLLALQDYCAGVHAIYDRTLEALHAALATASGERKRKLGLTADSFAHTFMTPATTFLQGLLAVNLTWMLDGCDSIGRFDQALGELFERDLDAGALDLPYARELLDELWQNFERLNGWNLQIGGYTPEGRDGTNALTLECIAACARNHFRRPNVAFRVTKTTPDSALIAALQALGDGSGRPALYNDDLYVDTLYNMDLGLTCEDAREIGFGGCTETMIAGLSNVGSLEGSINLAKALELALYDGYDPVSQTQQGPHTGSFINCADFDAFYTALKRQIQYMTDAFIGQSRYALAQRFHQGDPKMARTMFTRDCVKRHRSFEAGGARYNWSVVSYQGMGNLIDSLAAIKRCVFEDGTVSREELLHALTADFTGLETVRMRLQAVPKFGNDDAYVDEMGRDIITFAWQELYAHETPRGGRYLPSCILFVTYEGAGRTVGATPDGRKAFEVLTDSVGAVQGRDVHGPTALLNSVTRLPLALAVGTPVFNLRIQKSLMTTEEGLHAAAALIRTYFANGGMQVQLSVISKEEMLAARERPEAHKDLIVRIGGYSEYFTALSRELQDSVIARTEHCI